VELVEVIPTNLLNADVLDPRSARFGDFRPSAIQGLNSALQRIRQDGVNALQAE
jgi:hypothetical protein